MFYCLEALFYVLFILEAYSDSKFQTSIDLY